MRRSVVRVGMLLVLATAGAFAIVRGGEAQPVAFEFLRHEVAIDIRADGDIQVTQRFHVRLSSGTAGITTRLPFRLKLNPGRERIFPVEDLQVSAARGAATHTTSESGDEIVLNMRDGLEGAARDNEFVARYVQSGVLDLEDDATPVLRWTAQLLEGTSPLDGVRIVVTAPGAVLAAECVGMPCTSVSDGRTAQFETTTASARGLPVAVTLAAASVSVPSPIMYEHQTLQRAFTIDLRSVVGTLIVTGILAILFGRTARDLARDVRHQGSPIDVVTDELGARRQSPSRSVAIQDASPEGLSPAEVGALRYPHAPGLNIAVTVLDLARRGHFVIEEDAPLYKARRAVADWRLVRLPGAADPLTEFEAKVLHVLFRDADIVDLVAMRARSAGLLAAERSLRASMVERGWLHADPVGWRRDWLVGGAGAFTVGALSLLAAVQFTDWALVTLPIVIAGASILLVALSGERLLSHRTALGTSVHVHAAGFERYLAAPDCARAEELPYAIVLGHLHVWARATGFGVTPELTPWYRSASPDEPDRTDLSRLVEALQRNLRG